MERYKFCFIDRDTDDVIVEADNYQKALNKVIGGNAPMRGRLIGQYKWENRRWRRIYK